MNPQTKIGKCYALDEPGGNGSNGWVLTFDGPKEGYYWLIDRVSSVVDLSLLTKGADGQPASYGDCYGLYYFVHSTPIPQSLNDGSAQALGSHQENSFDFGLKIGPDKISPIVNREDLVHVENNYSLALMPQYLDRRLGNYVKEFNIPLFVGKGFNFTVKGDMKIDSAPDTYANTVGRIEYREYLF